VRHVLIAGSPFAPDTASAWWQFGVSTLTAFLTLAALGWSIWGTISARRDLVRERTQSASDLQAEKDKADRLEATRAATERRARAEAKASRQAMAIHLRSHWLDNEPDTVQNVEGQHATYNVIALGIVNDSDGPISDIEIFFDRLKGLRDGA